ncbi:unnamed protein product, partial [Pylaiella littoralis]
PNTHYSVRFYFRPLIDSVGFSVMCTFRALSALMGEPGGVTPLVYLNNWVKPCALLFGGVYINRGCSAAAAAEQKQLCVVFHQHNEHKTPLIIFHKKGTPKISRLRQDSYAHRIR